jgi:hypothetical protein
MSDESAFVSEGWRSTTWVFALMGSFVFIHMFATRRDVSVCLVYIMEIYLPKF